MTRRSQPRTREATRARRSGGTAAAPPRVAYRLRAAALLLALAGSSCEPGGRFQGIHCVAPANPGGGWDLTCRAVARALRESETSPTTVRVINLPGAGGGVAFANAVTQRRDDPNVLYAASPATTLRLAQGQYGHLTEHDVRWVGGVGAEYGILAVQQDAPWRSLEDLVRAWRRDPSSLVVSGGSAVAGQDHMKILLLARRAGIDPRGIRYVAFDGGGEALTALLGGFVDVFSGEASEVEGQVEAGGVRLLAVLSEERLGGIFADVPTALESGYDLRWVTWRGFYVPGQVADSVYARWVDQLRRLNESEAWQRIQVENRLRPFTLGGADFEAFVMDQVREFRNLSRDIGLLR